MKTTKLLYFICLSVLTLSYSYGQSISILSPADGAANETTIPVVGFVVGGVLILPEADGGHGKLEVILDGNLLGYRENEDAFFLPTQSEGEHTLSLQVVNYDNTPFDPAVIDESTFTVVNPTVVNNISELRNGDTDGTKYLVNGDLIFSNSHDTGNGLVYNHFIQDDTAGVLFFDPVGAVVPTPSRGDMINQMVGDLSFNADGILSFFPAEPVNIVSSGNDIIPQEMTIEEYSTSFAEYESQLIKITCGDIEEEGSFELDIDYTISSPEASTMQLTTRFGSFTNYPPFQEQFIPEGFQDIVGIAYNKNSTATVMIHGTTDMTVRDNCHLGVDDASILENILVSQTENELLVELEGKFSVSVFNLVGQKVASRLGDSQSTISTQTWRNGVYIVLVEQNNRKFTKKIVK